MSRSGSCLDNAAAESFFATLKTELVYRIVLVTKARARQRLIRWFDRYNQTRRHSHCGWRAPITYEKINTNTARAA
jgi:putative transposase